MIFDAQFASLEIENYTLNTTLKVLAKINSVYIKKCFYVEHCNWQHGVDLNNNQGGW